MDKKKTTKGGTCRCRLTTTFNNFPNKYSQEQFLVEDLLVESIKMYGADCYYIVRESITGSEQDIIYGEDPTAKFTKYYKIEMYMNNVLDSASGGDFMARFGLQINESVTLLISRRSFNRWVPANVATRPREGDLIFVPFSTNLYEIKHVEHEKNYYTLGRSVNLPYMYEVSCEQFRASQEKIATGIPAIDSIETEGSYTIQMALNAATSNADYNIGELVYQGNSYATANAIAQVSNWSPVTKLLNITNIYGVFSNTGNVTGVTTNTTYTITSYDPLEDHTDNAYTQNADMQDETEDIIIRVETNPFGTV